MCQCNDKGDVSDDGVGYDGGDNMVALVVVIVVITIVQ